MAFCYIGEKIKEKYFPEEKNYSPIQVNFLLKKPWERLEKEIEKSKLENSWENDNDIENNNPWEDKLNNNSSDLER